jgi:hypothetical protein
MSLFFLLVFVMFPEIYEVILSVLEKLDFSIYNIAVIPK